MGSPTIALHISPKGKNDTGVGGLLRQVESERSDHLHRIKRLRQPISHSSQCILRDPDPALSVLHIVRRRCQFITLMHKQVGDQRTC